MRVKFLHSNQCSHSFTLIVDKTEAISVFKKKDKRKKVCKEKYQIS